MFSIFYISQLTILIVLFLLLLSAIKNNKLRLLLSMVFSFLFAIEIVAILLTDKFVDYRFYYHMTIESIRVFSSQFIIQVIVVSVVLVSVALLLYYVSKRIHSSVFNRKQIIIPAILLSFILLCVPHGIFNETYKTIEVLSAAEKTFPQALIDLDIDPEEYVDSFSVTAEKGKNIIVIAVESLEQGFLGNSFDNIVPNITKLSKEWTYYDNMDESIGGSWTAASLYNYHVGMPAFFKGNSESIFQGASSVKLTGIGHVLNKAGYITRHVIGKKEFAGKFDILNAYGMISVSETNSIGDYSASEYNKRVFGLDDYDLFKEAKLQLEEMTKDNSKPFALFLLTLNTHGPDGIYDKRMEQYISEKDNVVEYSAAAVDYLINDFLIYLEENSFLDNTAVFIFPDHKFMQAHGELYNRLTETTRRLYLLSNIDQKDLGKSTADILHQAELPRVILNGAGIKTNAKFLVDYIKSDNIEEYINSNRSKLTSLNTASLNRVDYQSGFKIVLNDKYLTIQSAEDLDKIPRGSDSEIYDFTFSKDLVLLRSIGREDKEIAFKESSIDRRNNQLHLIVTTKNGELDEAYLGNKKLLGIEKKGTVIEFTQEEALYIVDRHSYTEDGQPVRYNIFTSIIEIIGLWFNSVKEFLIS